MSLHVQQPRSRRVLHSNLRHETLFVHTCDNAIVAEVKRIKAANEYRDVRRAT